MPFVSCSVEGAVDEPVAARVIEFAGADVGTIYVRNGKSQLLKGLPGYNNAARFQPWLVLLDLDTEADCAPALLSSLPTPAEGMCLRIAEHAIESWLLADADGLSAALSVSKSRIPTQPDTIVDPKELLVNLARRSRSSVIRRDVPPHSGSGRKVGPLYSSVLIEFASQHWRPESAIEVSPSLSRAIDCLRRLAES